jgi:hypothetical protein
VNNAQYTFCHVGVSSRQFGTSVLKTSGQKDQQPHFKMLLAPQLSEVVKEAFVASMVRVLYIKVLCIWG